MINKKPTKQSRVSATRTIIDILKAHIDHEKQERICHMCGVVKSFSEFGRSRGYINSYCKKCRSNYVAQNRFKELRDSYPELYWKCKRCGRYDHTKKKFCSECGCGNS